MEDDRFALWRAAWQRHRGQHRPGVSMRECAEPSCREAVDLIGPPLARAGTAPPPPTARERRAPVPVDDWGGLLERLLELEL